MPGELDEVLAAFEKLVRDHEVTAAQSAEEDTNFRCVDCVGCSSCRFCTACERCTDCTYCDACTDCEGCTQSRECLACASCSHSGHSAYCEKSSYLTLCLDCDGCVQCFACVGLSGEEFCVLNQRYTRRAYFKKVAELRAALDARTLEGWFPPWASPEADAEDAWDEHPTKPVQAPLAAAEPSSEAAPPRENGPGRADRGTEQRYDRDAPSHAGPEPARGTRAPLRSEPAMDPSPQRRQDSVAYRAAVDEPGPQREQAQTRGTHPGQDDRQAPMPQSSPYGRDEPAEARTREPSRDERAEAWTRESSRGESRAQTREASRDERAEAWTRASSRDESRAQTREAARDERAAAWTREPSRGESRAQTREAARDEQAAAWTRESSRGGSRAQTGESSRDESEAQAREPSRGEPGALLRASSREESEAQMRESARVEHEARDHRSEATAPGSPPARRGDPPGPPAPGSSDPAVLRPPPPPPKMHPEPVARADSESATLHPEPLTDIVAAERTGSWPPIDHASARALDRGGSSPWDALEEEGMDAEALFAERPTQPRGEPQAQTQPYRAARPHRAPPPAPGVATEASAGTASANPPPARPIPADATASRFGAQSRGAASRFERRDTNPAIGGLLEEDGEAFSRDAGSRALIDALPRASAPPAREPDAPQPVETPAAGRLARAPRPARAAEPTARAGTPPSDGAARTGTGPEDAPAERPARSLRTAKRPRRPGR